MLNDKQEKGKFTKILEVGIKYTTEGSVNQLGKNISKAFESSGVGSVLAKGFSAFITEKDKNPLVAGLKATFDGFIEMFGELINGAMDRLDTMLSYSQMTDANVRNLKLGYGFSSSEAYGYSSALEAVGLSSMEDLMYANEQQLSQFREAFDKYSNYYTELADSGYFEQMQEYQVEMREFKMDMEHEIIGFFMENKDVIMTSMKAIISVGEFLVESIGWIVDFFGDGSRSESERSREMQSVMNSYYANTKSTNVTISNEFNNIAQQDTTWLANSGQMTYQQVMKALE